MTENDLCEKLAIQICDISNGKEWDVTLAEEHKERHREVVLEEMLPIIRSYANGLVAAAVEACARGCQEILESRDEDDAKGIAAANLCAMNIESVTPESVAKELERIKEHFFERGREAAKKEEATLQYIFDEPGPIKDEIEHIKNEARLEGRLEEHVDLHAHGSCGMGECLRVKNLRAELKAAKEK